jgi:hypothetical protein
MRGTSFMTTATAVEVKETPIIFSGPMVNAILVGKKTQTRRVIKPQPLESWMTNGTSVSSKPVDWSQYYKTVRGQRRKNLWIMHPTENKEIVCPKGAPGDRLWVKEAIRYSLEHTNFYYCADNQGVGNDRFVSFMESRPDWSSHYRVRPNLNPRFMFRWASRITLAITEIRVERIQDISAADCRAEGVEQIDPRASDVTIIGRFRSGWDSINAKRGYSWDSNPWVWAISFRKTG